MTDYFELNIKINSEIEDIISNICFENLDCEGVLLADETYNDLELLTTTQGTLKVFLRTLNIPSPLEREEGFSIRDLSVNKAGVCEESVKKIADFLNAQRSILLERGFSDEDLGSWEFTLEQKENQDWSKKWKENWDVTHVSERIAVVPSWLEYEPKNYEIVILLDPGSAFGTGTHPTTQLCMRAIEKYLKIDDEMADIGTGSGILAIAASKFGAASAYGCDNDELVIDVAKENAKLNKICCNSFFEANTADKITDKFDFICANILHNVLAEIMGDLKNLMKPNAKMVLSGILDEKKQVVLDAIERYELDLIEESSQDDWVAFVVQR